MTVYVAEFWNTITNFLMIATALWGMFEVHVKGFEKRLVEGGSYHKKKARSFLFINILLLSKVSQPESGRLGITQVLKNCQCRYTWSKVER